MRFSTILGIYITCVEIIKAILSPPSISGAFIANAVGIISLLWLYGWGYYVFRGTLNGKELFPGHEHRTKAKEEILDYLENLIKLPISPSKELLNDLNHALNAAKLLGADKEDRWIEEALNRQQSITTGSEENSLMGKESRQNVKKIFCITVLLAIREIF